MPKRMSDDDLREYVAQLNRKALGYQVSKLSEQRRRALAYYLARPYGDLAPPAIEGRSKVVTTDVADTVEWMLPQLLKTFASGDKVVEFTARKPGDEQKASQATEYCNYVFHQQNPGFALLHTWFKDALIQKNGILKVWWREENKREREEYRGLTPAQLTILLQDPEHATKKIIEQAEYPDPVAQQQKQDALQQLQQQIGQLNQQLATAPAPQPGQPPQADPRAIASQQLAQLQQQLQHIEEAPVPMLYDITLQQTQPVGHICIENVPPEEFLISRDAKSLIDTPYVAHRVHRSISDLKAAGYKNVDDIKSDDDPGIFSAERIERVSIDDDMALMMSHDENPADPSMRMVWLTEAYLQVDYDGDGIAEWRKVTIAGDRLLDNELANDGHPFVSITPVPMPHRFFGTCPAEQAMETQRISTAIVRGVLDNLYLGVNGRYWALDNQVNLDDLLTVRPGGVVRVKSPDAVGRLDSGMGDVSSALEMLQFVKDMRQNRTGYTEQTSGGDADALNRQTAHAVQIATNRADQRMELIARNFAETGITDLFRRILKLMTMYQDKAVTVKLNGQWVDIDPREWSTGFDLTINVGLGTNNKDQLVQHIMALLQVQQQLAQQGIATPPNIYNAVKQLPPALGFKQPDLFFTDPQQNPQPPHPNPEMVRINGELQLQREKQQSDQALEQQRMQADASKIQMEAQADQYREQMKLQMRQMELQYEDAFNRWRTELENTTKVVVAQLTASQQPGVANTADQAFAGEIDAGRPAVNYPGPSGAGTSGAPAPGGSV